jgi:hypothetical protein
MYLKYMREYEGFAMYLMHPREAGDKFEMRTGNIDSQTRRKTWHTMKG